MRKPAKVSVSLCVAAVALAAAALTGPPKGSVEWHKREYLAARKHLDGQTFVDQCKRCFGIDRSVMNPGELMPRRLKAFAATESHHKALVDMGYLSECRIFVKGGNVEAVVRTFHNEKNCRPLVQVEAVTGMETNCIRISAPVREISTVSNLVRRIEQRLLRESGRPD